MRCLGLDLGTKTLGVALSDKANIIASPYKVLHYDGENYDILFKGICLKCSGKVKEELHG